jgi:hypothetical protein
VNEEAAAQQYLLDYLNADSTLTAMLSSGVWLRSVPQSSSFPAVKIDRQDSEDLMVVGLARVWANLSFLIRGIVHWRGGGQPDWTDVRAIGDRLDALLHDHEGDDGTVAVHSFREESYTDETIESGDLFLHVGGIYRVRARAV